MTKTKPQGMMERSIKAKKYVAYLVENNIGSGGDEVLYECWFDIAIMLGKYTPKELMPDLKDEYNVRLWNLLTEDSAERKFITNNPEIPEELAVEPDEP
jgi:hypothetical protein